MDNNISHLTGDVKYLTRLGVFHFWGELLLRPGLGKLSHPPRNGRRGFLPRNPGHDSRAMKSAATEACPDVAADGPARCRPIQRSALRDQPAPKLKCTLRGDTRVAEGNALGYPFLPPVQCAIWQQACNLPQN